MNDQKIRLQAYVFLKESVSVDMCLLLKSRKKNRNKSKFSIAKDERGGGIWHHIYSSWNSG